MFIFENVPGMLSAMPDGTPITDLIEKGFESIGYEIINDLKKYAKIDASEYGVPQNRERLIIMGIRKDAYSNPQALLKDFYVNILPSYKVERKLTVEESIGD